MTQINSKPSFNLIDGAVITPIGLTSVSGKFVTQVGDKILIAGQGGTNYLRGKIVISRYNNDGTLDTSFDSDGLVTSTLDNVGVQTVSVQSDGSIDITGRTDSYNIPGFVLRYDNKGTQVSSDATGNFYVSAPVEISADGRTDSGLFRYKSDGTLDKSFNVTGGATTDVGKFDTPRYVAKQPDGSILVAGTTSDGTAGNFLLLSYDSNGALDKSFGNSGVVTTDFDGKDDFISSLFTQSDGKILAVGSSGNTSGYNIAMARYHSNGSLDSSFGMDGKLTHAFEGTSDFGESVTLQSDGKILVAGETLVNSSGSYDFALLRFNQDGSLDTSFGNNGVVVTPVSANNDFAYHVAVQADGKILLTGGSNIDAARQNSELTLIRYNSDGSLDNSVVKLNTLDANSEYILNGSAVVMDNNVRIRDAELDATNDYNGATLVLERQDGANSQDIFTRSGNLVFHNGTVVIEGIPVGEYTQSGGALNITFNNNATTNRVNSVLQQLAYSSNAVDPSAIQVSWTFSDSKTEDRQSITENVKVNIIAGTDPTHFTGNNQIGLTTNDTLTGTKGKDFLSGNSGNDSLFGLDGNDTLKGDEGDDYMDGGAGKNTLIGGAGDDIYIVSQKSNKLVESLNNGQDLVISSTNFILGSHIENLTLVGTAKLNGSGNALDNIIYGNTASNTITGKSGSDGLLGGDGNDKLLGGVGDDNLFGEAGNDNLAGGVGNDKLYGGAGNDKLSGGAGNDLLFGEAGNDVVSGGNGSDIIIGGAGKDKLSGGKGADGFVLNSITETGVNKSTWDVITDFSSKQGDKMILSSIGGLTYIGNQAFSADSTGQLRFDAKSHVLYGNTDADSEAEFAIELLGVKALSAADFIL